MTWHPSSSSSVSKACFITARAISMKLGVRIRYTFDFRDLTYFVSLKIKLLPFKS
jgi:hypothetical protein